MPRKQEQGITTERNMRRRDFCRMVAAAAAATAVSPAAEAAAQAPAAPHPSGAADRG